MYIENIRNNKFFTEKNEIKKLCYNFIYILFFNTIFKVLNINIIIQLLVNNFILAIKMAGYTYYIISKYFFLKANNINLILISFTIKYYIYIKICRMFKIN